MTIKILCMFAVPTGGMETLNRQRCLALKRHGIACHLLYLQPGSGMQNIRSAGIPVHVTDEDEEIAALLRKENYDVVIVTFDYLLPGRLRKLGYEGPIIYDVQGLGNIEGATQILTAAKPHITAHANAILMPRTRHLNELVSTYYPHMKKYSFHNCIDTEKFRHRRVPVPEYPVIGWVGRIEYIKNWQYFLDICHPLIQRIPALRIWIFEDRSLAVDNDPFEQLVDQYQLAPRLVRHSNIPHSKMADYYSMIGDSGGLLCSTSILEGFGYAQLEAMLCSCPVATTDSDGVRSFLQHNVTGKFLPQNNVQEAVNEIVELMNNQALRHTIRSNAGKQATTPFSYKTYSAHVTEMLRDLGVSARRKWWRF
ncbi:glycosyltransferase family 4 protein [Cohnella suwonensis]|uniref:Glycosyltransferase family 4 protein n=1 Tax=Cohnella suwonensis TaxID=696072 RepID=A0ABW0LW48_9BACL